MSVKKIINNLFSISKPTNAVVPPTILDLDTEQGILSITKKDFFRQYHGQDLYYALQRKATQHKKDGNMDVAIACLRKSNEISDCYSRPPLSEKDYIRLVTYLKNAGYDNEASIEEQAIYSKHPEFKDKSLITKKLFNEACKNARNMGSDLITAHSSEHCKLCKPYNNKIYSMSGKSIKYPPVPNMLRQGGPCKEHTINFTTFFLGISTDLSRKK